MSGIQPLFKKRGQIKSIEITSSIVRKRGATSLFRQFQHDGDHYHVYIFRLQLSSSKVPLLTSYISACSYSPANCYRSIFFYYYRIVDYSLDMSHEKKFSPAKAHHTFFGTDCFSFSCVSNQKLKLKQSVPRKESNGRFLWHCRKVHSPANLRNPNNKMCGLNES